MQLKQLDVTGKQIAPPLTLDCAHRRLPSVIRAHVDQTRPFMIAVQRRSRIEVPLDESWVIRPWKVAPVKSESGEILTQGVPGAWPRKYLALDAEIVIVYLPHGGSGSSSAGSRGKSPLMIVAGIAGLALAAFAGPLGAAAAATFFSGSATAGAVLSAGITIGGLASGSLASRSNLTARRKRNLACRR